jgi:hypothetical protein
MAKSEAQTGADKQNAPVPVMEKHPPRPEKMGGPLMTARGASIGAAVMRSPAPGGAPDRARQMGGLQRSVGNARLSRASGDVYEQEADQVAEQVMRPAAAGMVSRASSPLTIRRMPFGRPVQMAGAPVGTIQRQEEESEEEFDAAPDGEEGLDESGAMEDQGQQGQAPATSEAGPIQRKILLGQPTTGGGPITFSEMTRRQRRRFARRHFRRSRDRSRAVEILEDMARAADAFRFDNEAELETEVQKRIATSRLMQESQTAVGDNKAFGYPFTNPSLYWGPRVNYAARDYWEPPVVDNYSRRRDRAKRVRIAGLPRWRRYEVYGDPEPGEYSWGLTAAGKADPYSAINQLFRPQSPHKRTLIHCDYLVSLVHYRSYAAAVGRTEFNRRLQAFGVDRIRLRYDAFSDLDLSAVVGGATVPGIGSLQTLRPSSPADLVIGDHVYFWNHSAYDVLNQEIGNAWRLENAVLIERNRRGEDIFLGHGSGRKTARQMRAKLAHEYNDVAGIALRLVAQTRSGSSSARARAEDQLRTRFPNVHRVGSEWRIQGTNLEGVVVDEVLREIRPHEVIGLYDPVDPTQMYQVRRPAESR